MKLNKNIVYITLPLAVLTFMYWLWQRKNKFYKAVGPDGVSGASDDGYVRQKYFDADDFKAIVPKLVQKHGQALAKTIEQVFRWETAHFTSGQYKYCGSPGMEVHGPAPTYGWYAPFFALHPSYLPIGTHKMPENGTGISKTFVVMPSVEAAAMFLADYIKRHGTAGRWYSTNPTSQANYIAKISTVTPKFVNGTA